MALVTGVVLPNNGDRIKTENYNDPITKILAQVNGNLDGSNIATNSLPWSAMSTQANVIPDSALVDTGGWRDLSGVPSVISSAGQKEHVIRYTGVDHTGKLQAGTKLRIPRTGTTPTTSMAFVSASSQYATKASPTNVAPTTAFACEAWVYLDSYGAGHIVSRRDTTNGFYMELSSSGQLQGTYASAGSYTGWTTYQSIPLNKWTHIAVTVASISGKTTDGFFIDGVSVPVNQNTAGATTITNTGNLTVGSWNTGSGNFFTGKIANIRVWSTSRTAAQIRDNMNQENPAITTGLIAHFKGNGSWNDSSANANHLTAVGGAVNNFASHPYSSTEYAIATKVQYTGGDTDVTIFTGSGTLPNETLGQTSFSNDRTPYGFPNDAQKWAVTAQYNTDTLATLVTNAVWVAVPGASLTIPLGNWRVGMKGNFAIQTTGAAGVRSGWVGMATTLPTDGGAAIRVPIVVRILQFASQAAHTTATMYDPKTLTAQTVYNVYSMSDAVTVTETGGIRAAQGIVTLFAECPYV